MPVSEERKKTVFGHRTWRRIAVLLFGFFLFGWLGHQPPVYLKALFLDVERQFLDWRFLLRGMVPPPGNVVIVGLDDSSFRVQEDYRAEDFEPREVFDWMRPSFSPPWDRRVFAKTLDKLLTAGAKAVAFDFVFLGENPGDEVFVEKISEAPDRVVLGNQITYRESEAGSVQVGIQDPHDTFLFTSPEPHLGFVNVYPDRDRILRRTPLGINLRWERLLADGQEDQFGGDPAEISATEMALSWSLREAGEPGAKNPGVVERPLIHYYGPQGNFPAIPIEALFIRERWEGSRLQEGAFFKDKFVIVAPLSELRFKDLHPTPFGMMYGAEIHATLLGNLLEDEFLQEVSEGERALIFLLLALVWLGAFFLLKSLLWRTVVLFFCLLGYLGLAYFAFTKGGVVWPVSGPVFAFGLAALWGMTYDTGLLQYDRQRIKKMFGSYLAPELVAEMVESGTEPALGGEETEITAFFSDIESFSSFSEQMSARELVNLMNEYLSAAGEILQQEKGTLDKFIGDAMVAMFGAPLPLPDHSYRAVVTALRMLKNEKILREKWAAERESRGWPEMVSRLHTRIGIHTGPAVVGNMGSDQRFNYTMMGDTVNLAARLESGAKSFGVYLLVSGEVVEKCREQAKEQKEILFRPIDRIVVKGRETPVEIYEPIDFLDKASSRGKELVDCFSEGLEAYRRGDFEQARTAFLESEKHEVRFGFNPSRLFLDRVEVMRRDPPGPDWDGVFRMTNK
ncbi:MAG: adenylate/guanylate cyclase domain-containing protein [Opitutales bacterium]|nr:adenylate/guanylate cyclase domain-containing protein [Opitutales bacterium]